MRQIVLDTETTGLEFANGDRVIEIGCVEIIDRSITGSRWHCYINPKRDISDEAVRIHGITSDFLADKPVFSEIIHEFIDYLKGADELIAHNAPFDVGFLNHEIKLDGNRYDAVENLVGRVVDSFRVAKEKHPGAKASLDALCKRYFIDNSNRDLHGALLDADLLAKVYLAMTGGQEGLQFGGEDNNQRGIELIKPVRAAILPVIYATDNELSQHHDYLSLLSKKSGKSCEW